MHYFWFMARKIDSLVDIDVSIKYVPDFIDGQYFFKYTINMLNVSTDAIILLSRHWFISDFPNPERQVDGEGVVGEQPLLQPGESYQYSSGVALSSPLGSLTGYYDFRNLRTGNSFEVDVPDMNFVADFLLN